MNADGMVALLNYRVSSSPQLPRVLAQLVTIGGWHNT